MPLYQSQSLTFLRRTLRQMREGVARTARRASVLSLWSLQIALYPIYVVFQSSRLISRQIQAAVRRTLPRLQSVGQSLHRTLHPDQPPSPQLTADIALHNTLRSLPCNDSDWLEIQASGPVLHLPSDLTSTLEAALEHPFDPEAPILHLPEDLLASGKRLLRTPQTLSSPQGESTRLATGKPLPIQGIASWLSDRHLVLVGTGNIIVDVLSPQQQQHLQDRLVQELAAYYHHQRQQQLAHRPVPRRLPPPKVEANQWLPVQWFRQLMAWMQTSDVAIATNVFQESTLLPSQPLATNGTFQGFWQRFSLGWIQDLRSSSEKRLELPAPAPTANFPTPGPSLPSEPLPSEPLPSELPPQPNAQTFLVQVLQQMRASFNTALVPVPSPASAVDSVSPPPHSPDLDLLGWPSAPAIAQTQWGKLAPLTASGIEPEDPHSQDSQTCRSDRGNRPKTSSLTPFKPEALHPLTPHTESSVPPDLESPDLESTDLELIAESHNSLEQTARRASALETESEWIDTDATLVGYDKHPLEAILEWLDRRLLWIEQHLAQVWRWLKRRFLRRPKR